MNFQLHLVVQMSNPKASVSPKPLLTQLEPWLQVGSPRGGKYFTEWRNVGDVQEYSNN